jgi:glycosyltransferase involved in cell wall biosynthesis
MKIIFTVFNDLFTDQRMIRICSSLAAAGYKVTLAGKKNKGALPLPGRSFEQHRMYCFFRKGKAAYLEFNVRLFFYLLFHPHDAVCAIDLDTILPCYFTSVLKKTKRVYDAHELFCEMKEIVTRPAVYRAWKKVERFTVPRFRSGYTVNDLIADEFYKMYGVQYEVIRNLPVLNPLIIPEKAVRYILYQGAVNEGRCFETLIPAMHQVDAQLVICGEGNFLQQAIELVQQENLGHTITFMGKLPPDKLVNITRKAWAGVTLFDKTGLSNYYSLANRFFDYCHAGIPQVCVNFPVYKEINNQHPIAVCIDDQRSDTIAAALNQLLNDSDLYNRLQQQCLVAREVLNWQAEEMKLLEFWNRL